MLSGSIGIIIRTLLQAKPGLSCRNRQKFFKELKDVNERLKAENEQLKMKTELLNARLEKIETLLTDNEESETLVK